MAHLHKLLNVPMHVYHTSILHNDHWVYVSLDHFYLLDPTELMPVEQELSTNSCYSFCVHVSEVYAAHVLKVFPE